MRLPKGALTRQDIWAQNQLRSCSLGNASKSTIGHQANSVVALKSIWAIA